MIRQSDNFYLQKTEPNKGCLLALRSLILQQDPLISETLKYGIPCFGYRKRGFCYLNIDKKTNEPYILMVEGKRLDDPALETGNRSRMKILRINAHDDLPVKIIETILQQALNLYRTGVIKA